MDALAEARAVLPSWVCWFPLLYPPIVFFAAWLGLGLAAWVALRPLRGHDQSPWYERARRAYPGRMLVARFGVLVPLLLAIAVPALVGPLASVHGTALGVVCALAALVMACRMQIRTERRLRGERATVGSWARGRLFYALIFAPSLPVFVFLLLVLPKEMDQKAIVLLVVGVLAQALLIAGGSIRVARAVGLLRPAADRLRRVVDEAADEAGVRPRASYEIAWSVANAYALPVTRDLVFTQGALDVLSDAELRAVAAHELAHLGESRVVVFSRVLGTFLLVPLAASGPIVSSYGFPALAAAILAVLVASQLLRRLGRRMEERADRAAKAQEGDAGTYACALAKIHEANLMPVVMPSKRQLHPHLYDRLIAAGVAPDYPRPAAPSRARMGWTLLLALVIGLLPLTALAGVHLSRFPTEPADERPLLWKIALTGGGEYDLVRLARLRSQDADITAAEALYRAAAAIDPSSPYGPRALATFLIGRHRFQEATSAIEEAYRRLALREPQWQRRSRGSVPVRSPPGRQPPGLTRFRPTTARASDEDDDP